MALERNPKLLLTALALSSLTSCLTGNLGRTKVHELVPDGASSHWVAGQTRLADCLIQLGAPVDVWETADGGAVLAWYGSDESGWSLTFSVPVGQALNASASYSDIQDEDLGVVLFFDERWILTTWAQGQVAELVRDGHRRPSFAD
jgi:hypothetical protein